MPQGGPGNAGGNLMGPGGSKKGLRGGGRTRTLKPSKAQPATPAGRRAVRAAPAPEPAPQGAHTVIQPRPERRAKLVAAQRRAAKAESALEERRATRLDAVKVQGTGSAGAVVGGASELPARQARLVHQAKQQQQKRAAQAAKQEAAQAERDAPIRAKQEKAAKRFAAREKRERSSAARAAADLSAVRLQRQQLLGDATAASQAVTGVAEVLDALSARLGGEEAASCCRTLQKVLDTALTKEEPKYRRLRARNERLWALLLRHPEMLLLLQAAGFEEASSVGSEAEEVQAALAAQLDSAQPDQTVVESLVSRMEALVPGADEQAAGEGRTAEFVHPGGAALAALAAVLEAVGAWAVEVEQPEGGFEAADDSRGALAKQQDEEYAAALAADLAAGSEPEPGPGPESEPEPLSPESLRMTRLAALGQAGPANNGG